jgi:hypothetical protein
LNEGIRLRQVLYRAVLRIRMRNPKDRVLYLFSILSTVAIAQIGIPEFVPVKIKQTVDAN